MTQLPASVFTTEEHAYSIDMEISSNGIRASRHVNARLREDVGPEDEPDPSVLVASSQTITSPPENERLWRSITFKGFADHICRSVTEHRPASLRESRNAVRWVTATVEAAVTGQPQLDGRVRDLGARDDAATRDKIEETPEIPSYSAMQLQEITDKMLTVLCDDYGTRRELLQAIQRYAKDEAEKLEGKPDAKGETKHGRIANLEGQERELARKKMERLDGRLLPGMSDSRTFYDRQTEAGLKVRDARLRAHLYRLIEQRAKNLVSFLAGPAGAVAEVAEILAAGTPTPRFGRDRRWKLTADDVERALAISGEPSAEFRRALLTGIAEGDWDAARVEALTGALDKEQGIQAFDIGTVWGLSVRNWALASGRDEQSLTDAEIVRLATDNLREVHGQLIAHIYGQGMFTGKAVSQETFAMYGGRTTPPIDWDSLGVIPIPVAAEDDADQFFFHRLVLLVQIKVNPAQLVFMDLPPPEQPAGMHSSRPSPSADEGDKNNGHRSGFRYVPDDEQAPAR